MKIIPLNLKFVLWFALKDATANKGTLNWKADQVNAFDWLQVNVKEEDHLEEDQVVEGHLEKEQIHW